MVNRSAHFAKREVHYRRQRKRIQHQNVDLLRHAMAGFKSLCAALKKGVAACYMLLA